MQAHLLQKLVVYYGKKNIVVGLCPKLLRNFILLKITLYFDFKIFNSMLKLRQEKTNNVVYETGLTQTELYKHRRWLEAGNFGFRK